MAYDYQKLFSTLIAEVQSSDLPQQRMLRVINECESQHPHPDWALFRNIDFDQELDSLNSWLTSAIGEADDSEQFKGLWFGLNNPGDENGTSADIYLAASPEFAFGELDWACESTFYPDTGPLCSKVLNAIYQIAYAESKSLKNDAEYPLVLAYGAIIARAALEQHKFVGPFSFLKGAAVGFDSGDFLFLGRFDNGKFILDVQAG